MIPIRLELTNFLAYKNPAPLDFTGIHVAVLTGENGAGKSSLLDAITWALWSRARAKTDNELVHQGQTEMRVEFTFALGEQVYRVIRARRVGRGAGSVLDFQIQNDAGKWASIAEATIPKTQEKIIRTLRLEHDTFVNSAYIMQGKADEFTGKRPTERKQGLADILGLQAWERYEERAKEKIKGIEKDIAEVGARLREAEAGWAQIDAARQAMIALDRQIEQLTKRILDAEKELAALDADLREAQSRADATSISRQQEAVQQRLAQLEELDAERERMAEARRVSGELAGQLRGQNEAARVEADGLKKRVETLQAATEPRCPTCGLPLSEAERTQLVAELNAEVEARREAYRQNQAQLKTLSDEQAALDKSLKQSGEDLREKPALIKQVAELQTALVQAGEAKEKIAGLTERRARWQQAAEKDRAERAQLDVQAERYTAILRDSAAKQAALDRLRQEDTLTKARMGAAQQKLSALYDLARQRETKRAERSRLADDKGIYEELREAFGKRGVPAMMIEAAVPEIEAAANALLTRMTGGRMHVRFMTQRETQAGETRETLDIQIADELGTRAYEMYSIDGTEPVCIRRNGQIANVPIQDLWHSERPTSQLDGYEVQAANFEGLCYANGRAVWLPVQSLLRHSAPQEMLKVTL